MTRGLHKIAFNFTFSFFISVSAWAQIPSPRLPEHIIPVPIISQAIDYSCGAAALLGVLYYWQVYDGGEAKLYKPLNTTKANGTAPEYIASVAHAFGLEVIMREHESLETLARALSSGYTAILEIQAWKDPQNHTPWSQDWDDGHYVVLVGMDPYYLYFMDPSAHGGYGSIPISEFVDRWHDYDVVAGNSVRHEQLGIFIRGNHPLRNFPTNVIPIQ